MKDKCKVFSPNIVITIDGPSASGKSTVARMVSEKIKCEHVDTGAIYRAIAVWCNNNCWTEVDAEIFIPRLDEIKYKVEVCDSKKTHTLDGIQINNKIRLPNIAQLASKIAVIKEIRQVATNIQREIAKGKCVVVEGRDAGSVVFPRAPIKVYLTAATKERAERRLAELRKKNPNKANDYSLEEVIQELNERDCRDTERKCSPLKKPIDALSVDTTDLKIEEVVNQIVKVVKLRRPGRPNLIWRFLMGERRAHTTFVYKAIFLFTTMIYKIFYRIKIYGIENFPFDDDCATIVAPNHSSYIDPPAMGISCPCEMHALGVDYLFKAPVIKWILPQLNVYPVANDVTDAKVIRVIVSLLRERRNVLIFPEGARSPDGKLLPFKRGVATLASLSGCSITPTYIDGAFKIWKRENLVPWPWGKLSIVYGKPLYWSDYASKYPSKREAQDALTADVKASIQHMKDTFVRK